MKFASKNMNYVFNVEYFHGIDLMNKDNVRPFKERNKAICAFPFDMTQPFAELRELEGFKSFSLYTAYPGLLIGTGNPHDAKQEEAIKAGFSLDYVTGLPYLPGSSLKGLLRSYFKERELICVYLGRETNVEELEKEAFEGKNVFLGAYPVASDDGTLLAMEYITPHKDKFTNPIPISLMKTKSNVRFEFCFLLRDAEKAGVSADDLAKLFKRLVTEMGVGAKTNVGFGRMTEKKAEPNKMNFDNDALKLVENGPKQSTGKDGAASCDAGDQSRRTQKGTAQPMRGKVLGNCPKCGAEISRNGKWLQCAGNCGMRFGKIFGQYMPSDEEYRTMLSGGAIHAVIEDRNGTPQKTEVRIGGASQSKKDPNVFYPRWKTRVL